MAVAYRSYTAVSGGSTATWAIPAGTIEGDIMFATFARSNNYSGNNVSTAFTGAGWTVICGTGFKSMIAYKVAGASESSIVVSIGASYVARSGGIASFSGGGVPVSNSYTSQASGTLAPPANSWNGRVTAYAVRAFVGNGFDNALYETYPNHVNAESYGETDGFVGGGCGSHIGYRSLTTQGSITTNATASLPSGAYLAAEIIIPPRYVEGMFFGVNH